MNAIRSASAVIARFLLSAIFLTAGINKIFHWHEADQMLLKILSDWQSHLSAYEIAQTFFSSLTTFSPMLLLAATLMEFGGALLILLGIKEKIGAALLLMMLIPATILFHQFWFVDNVSERELQQVMFLKNLSIIGGLILVLFHGAQPSHKKDAATIS